MSIEIALRGAGDNFSKALASTRAWCADNQWAVGLGEMAVGASLVAWGVQNGVIEMGREVLGTGLGSLGFPAAGGMAGVGLGGLAGHVLGGIGVAAGGTAIGIPTLLVAGGAAAVFGLAGYGAGSLLQNLMPPAVDVQALVQNGALLTVGVALIVHGARTLVQDDKALAMLSAVVDRTLVLTELTARVVACSKTELQGFYDELRTWPQDPAQAALGAGSAAVAGWGGAVVGGTVAVGSVTVLGSSTLGSVALSLGLVSAPLWPVIAGITGGAGLGYATYKAARYWSKRGTGDEASRITNE